MKRVVPVRLPLVAIVVALFAGGCRVGGSAALANGQRQFAAGHYDQSLEFYRLANSSQPHDATALFGAGAALYRLKRYQEAIQAFTSAAGGFENSRDRARALHNLGNALVGAERYDDALEAYRQALRLEDRDNTRLNYLLIRGRRGSANAPPRESPVTAHDDERLFEVARRLDAPTGRNEHRDTAGKRPLEW